MSVRPEHTREDADAACPFCDYAGPSAVIREWDDALAIEPLNPVVDGHLLVITKPHVETAGESSAWAGAAFRRAAEIAAEIGDCNIIQSNGPAATQTVRHLHVHVVPRRDGDGLLLPWSGIDASEGREGMVRAFDHHGEYVGCIGEQTWRWLLDHPDLDQPALDRLVARNQQLQGALAAIEEKARWYADNGSRLPLEVDHALCVEVLSLAQDALDAALASVRARTQA